MSSGSQHEQLILSIDVGTSGVKTGLFTADGQCKGHRSMPLTAPTTGPGWSELDLEEAWKAISITCRQIVADHDASSAVIGIGLSVASPTVVAVGRDGRPLSRALTYSDSRTQPRLDEIRQRVGEEWHRQLTGNRLSPALCSAAGMLHLVEEHSALLQAGLRVGHLNSYLVGRLTGRWVIDWTNASYTGLVDIRRPGEWSQEACEVIGISERLLPTIVAPWEPVGRISHAIVEELGLDRSAIVVAGAADTACSAYSVGCVEDGDVFESLGTSGVLTICRASPSGSPLFMNRSHVLPERWLSHGAMSAAGAATRWLADNIFSNAAVDSNPHETKGLAWLETEAAKSPPGAGGVAFLPYLSGERSPVWDPYARGAWIGMSVASERRHLIRAVFESSGYGIRQLLEREEEHRGSEIEEVLLVGGGARSRFWTSMKADITNKTYLRAEEVESAARGASMLAAVGAGIYCDARDALLTVRIPETEEIKPTTNPSVIAAYNYMYQIYVGLYPALRETFGVLSQRAWPT